MTDNSKITGFDTLSTLRFEGFTERNMSELEQILHNLDKSESVQNIKDLYINIYNHVHSSGGHNIDLSAYKDTFLGRLYEVYRRYGNTGTMLDMLQCIEKNIPIATNNDIDAGFNTTKAVTAMQFKSVFKKHIDNPSAHKRVYDALVPRSTFVSTPTLAIMNTTEDMMLGNAQDFWNTHDGTMVIKYKDPEAISSNTENSGSDTIGVLIEERLYPILGLYGTVEIILFMSNHSSDKHKLFIQINGDVQELPRYENLAKDTLVMCYVGNKLIIGTTKEITEITLSDILDIDYIGISTFAHRFVYYPQQATVDEMRFLLN